jgi:energy-converting hydrogenase A subunit M
MDTSQLIAHLNSLNLGEMDGLRDKLEQARRACLDLQQDELADYLRDAVQALAKADVKTYRKRVETVIARLGHIR